MSLRRRPGRFLPFVLVFSLGLGWTAPATAAPPEMADVIVVLHDGVDARAAARDMAQSHDARIGHVYEYALTGFAAEVPEGRLEGLQRDPRVAYVDENRVVRMVEDSYPNGVLRIDGNDAHGSGAANTTGSGVRVAVLDTGIDLQHTDLDDNVDRLLAKDCIGGGNGDDDQGHGTHVAGTIAAEDNGGDVIGVAPAARLVPVKVLDSTGSGTWEQVICGIDWITELNSDADSTNNVHVGNISLGAKGTHDGTTCANHEGSTTLRSTSLFDALCKAMAKGTTFTVAAGNDAIDASGFIPAAYPDVVTVSAYSDTNGQYDATSTCSGKGLWKTCDERLASFSNYGSVVDVTAPGVNILSTISGGGTGNKSGTSMAAPHVAGVAALVVANAGWLKPADLATRLKDTGQCPDGEVNPGSLDCAGAWNSDPDGVAEPMVNANWAATGNTGSSTTNTAPVAVDDEASTPEDAAVTVQVLGNDTDVNTTDVLTVSGVGAASFGTAAVTADKAAVTYTPDGNWHGADSFTYTVSDGNGGTDTGIVSVTVSPVNDAPIAGADTATTPVGTAVTFDVVGNDTDPENDSFSVTAVADPTNGMAAVMSGTSVTYTPDAGFAGTETFAYTVTDVHGASASGSITVTVGAATTMHVGDLDGSSAITGATWTATVRILIVDDAGQTVSGATVSGTWSDGATGSASCTTGSDGTCTVSKAKIRKTSSVKLTVSGVSHGTLAYSSADNTNPDGDVHSDGTSIVVHKA